MQSLPTFLKEILTKKQSHAILDCKREVPLNPPHLSQNLIIAEIKRASPSAGDLSQIPNPIALAEQYLQGGANIISVLCEEDYFKGSLEDLRAIKSAFPQACVLRKDFITQIPQIAESYAFGADMVLLIAAVFMNGENGGFKQLCALYEECLKLGLTPLLEVHNLEEIEFIAPLNASLIGVNARNLHTFEIHRIHAFNLLDSIKAKNPHAKVIFESSLSCSFDGFVVGSVGFDGILCGSYFVQSKEPQKAVKNLKDSLQKGRESQNTFFKNTFKLLESPLGLIKVCGITNTKDARMCAQSLQKLTQKNCEKIAALGFILEPQSKRFVEEDSLKVILESLRAFPHLLKIAVIKEDKIQLKRALELYESGEIDALQLHGITHAKSFAGIDLQEADFAFYEVWNVEKPKDLGEWISPFVLLDSKSHLGGGSSVCIPLQTLKDLHLQTLCVAGGVGIENLADLKALGAKMLDFNSSLESSKGKKDSKKLEELAERLHSSTF